MRQLFFRVIAGSVVLLGCLLSIEVVAIGYLTLRDGQYMSAATRFSRLRNTYIVDVTRAGPSCRYIDTLFPHPYLAFVHHRNPPCGISHVNNIGLWGPDFLSERAADAYVVLLTGGSVAAQLGQLGGPTAPRLLELALNERFASPNGKPFRVLNGGDGAWKQPQQTILFLLFVDAIDAVVTLDGFNEHPSLSGSLRFEYPATNFAVANPLASDDFGSVVLKWMTGKLVARVRASKIAGRSHAAYLLIEGLETRVLASAGGTGHRGTTLESIFALPPQWDRPKREAWAIGQYEKYIRAMNAIARDRHVLVAHFIQPAPAIGKSLTEEEKAVVGDLGYAESYAKMTEKLLALRRSGVKIYSLLDLFADDRRTLYEDSIHLKREAGGDSPGYRVMAARMAELLGEAWGLEKR